MRLTKTIRAGDEEKVKGVLDKAIKEIDKEYNDMADERKWKSGTTAIVSIVREDKLFTACVGDSRTVLYRNKVPKAVTKVLLSLSFFFFFSFSLHPV